MAIEKTLSTRLKLRYDSHENWIAADPVLLAGEVALSTVSVAQEGTVNFVPSVLIKVGDGTHKYSELDFAYAKSADVLAACKSETALTTFINNVIAGAGIATNEALATLTGRVDTAEGKITALEGLVGETGVAEQISTAIANLKLEETYATKEHEHTKADITDFAHEHAISEVTGLQDALDGLQVKGDYAAAEHTHAIDDVTGLQDAIDDAKKAGTDAQDSVDALAAKVGTVEEGKTVVEMIEAAQTAATYDDTEVKADIAALEGLVGETAVSEQIATAIANENLADTYAAKVHIHEISDVSGLSDALAGKQAVGDYATKAEAQAMADAKDEAIEAAQAAADKAQEEVDALETYVGTIPEGYSEATVIAYIDKKAEEAVATAGTGTSNVLGQLNSYKVENDAAVQANADAIDALEALVGDTSVATQISDAVTAEETRAKGVESGLETRLAAVESDYLKAADKTELEEAIATNASAIELLTNGVDAEKVDGVNDLIKYVEEHGTEVTGIKADIKANADAIDVIEADYLKASDKTELAGDIADLEGRMDSAESSIATNITNIVANKASITALEGLVGDISVATQISTAVAAEAEIARAAEEANADAIDALEAKAHEHANKDVLDGVSAEKVASWDAAVQTVTAGTGLTATKTGTDVAIAFDDSVTFIFDCGGAE